MTSENKNANRIYTRNQLYRIARELRSAYITVKAENINSQWDYVNDPTLADDVDTIAHIAAELQRLVMQEVEPENSNLLKA